MGPAAGNARWPAHYLRGYLVAWLAYAGAGMLLRQVKRPPRWWLGWIVVVGIALHLVAFARTPRGSTDIYRYLWDGRVINAGINPYLFPPNAPELVPLRDENWRHINFKHVATIYPPAAQMLFAGLARLDPGGLDLFRLTFAAFDIGLVLILIPLLRRTGRAPENVLWYAWCPLAITETAAGGHLDVVGVFLLALAMLLAARAGGRPGRAGALALAAAVMTKGLALFAAPFFIKRGGLRFTAWFAAGCALLLAPFLGAREHLFAGLFAYLSGWKANSGLFMLADWMLEHVTERHYQLTRLGSLALILAATVWLVRRQGPGVRGIIAGAFAALSAVLLFGAPVPPWYLTWTLPLLCWWWVPGWLAFTLTAVVQFYAGIQFPESVNLLLWLGYSPVFALLIWQWLTASTSAGGRRSTESAPPPCTRRPHTR